MKIATPDDLPPEWREKYERLRASYIKMRLWEHERDAALAAFNDTRSEFWRGVDKLGNPVDPQSDPKQSE